MGFSTAGTNEFANAATVGRLAGDPLGTMQSPALYTASTTAYNPPGDPGGASGRRWGDYSYTSLDPNDDMTMWTIQEFCNATNSYGVRVVKLIAPPPATPSSSSPSTVPAGQASVNVTITGTSTSGSGFFDPGTGFPNRITAAVSGGVTVNSVTFVNPMTVTLNLSTVGAVTGMQNVTITNPDGQSATGTGILSVTAGAVSSTAVSTSQTPTVFGQSVTFTATVTGGSGTPTGTVQFKDGTVNLGLPVPLNASGAAMLSTSALAVGSHSITGVYSGNATYLGSTSPTVTQVVNQASTSTALSSAPNPSELGRTTVFTATVSATPPGGGTPDGSVQFFDGTNSLGTTSLSGGTASLSISTLTQGNHNITAVYSGSGSYSPSTSPVLVQTVLKKRRGQLVSQ